MLTRLPIELNTEVSRVADQNRVVRLPYPRKECSLKKDKNQSLRSSQGKLGRKTKKGKVSDSLIPITRFFERKTLLGQGQNDGMSNYANEENDDLMGLDNQTKPI